MMPHLLFSLYLTLKKKKEKDNYIVSIKKRKLLSPQMLKKKLHPHI